MREQFGEENFFRQRHHATRTQHRYGGVAGSAQHQRLLTKKISPVQPREFPVVARDAGGPAAQHVKVRSGLALDDYRLARGISLALHAPQDLLPLAGT